SGPAGGMVLSTPASPHGAGGIKPLALWVLPVSNLAGVARHTLDALGAGIPDWRVVALAPSGPLVAELEKIGVAVVADAFGPEAGLVTSIRTLRRVCDRLHPAIVHTHLAYADIVAALTPLSGAMRISTEHGIAAADQIYQGSHHKAQIMRRIHQARLHRADALIAVCQSTAATMRRNWRTQAPITVILNGVDPPVERNSRPPTFDPHILSLSRLAPEKRIDALLQAFAVLVREHPGARLTIAGEGELDQPLRELVARLGIADKVSLSGFVDAAEALTACDVVVQLSVWENCSYTLLDAVAAGVGVVASPAGGNPEILPAQCLVDPADPADVARAILTQACDAGARPAQLRHEWPSTAAMARAIAAVYECATP
ncbi:MAG: glycosyltransferase, partial [Actinomycetota bacterium]|nr:glycosyltransferase [Actinomycetota bacterium]